MVNIREASGHTLRGLAIARTTLKEHATIYGDRGDSDRATAMTAAATAATARDGEASESVESTGNEHAFV